MKWWKDDGKAENDPAVAYQNWEKCKEESIIILPSSAMQRDFRRHETGLKTELHQWEEEDKKRYPIGQNHIGFSNRKERESFYIFAGVFFGIPWEVIERRVFCVGTYFRSDMKKEYEYIFNLENSKLAELKDGLEEMRKIWIHNLDNRRRERYAVYKEQEYEMLKEKERIKKEKTSTTAKAEPAGPAEPAKGDDTGPEEPDSP